MIIEEEGVYIVCCLYLQEVEAAKKKNCKNRLFLMTCHLDINIYFCHRFLLSTIKISRIELSVVIVIDYPLRKKVSFLKLHLVGDKSDVYVSSWKVKKKTSYLSLIYEILRTCSSQFGIVIGLKVN